jgi:hypothetical protein
MRLIFCHHTSQSIVASCVRSCPPSPSRLHVLLTCTPEQRRAWQRHKKVCESGNGELQKLPSQQAFEGQMERVLSSDFVACAASPALAGQIESIRSGMSDEQRVKYGKALKNIRRQPYDHVDGREYAPLPSFMRVQPELD